MSAPTISSTAFQLFASLRITMLKLPERPSPTLALLNDGPAAFASPIWSRLMAGGAPYDKERSSFALVTVMPLPKLMLPASAVSLRPTPKSPVADFFPT